MTPLHVGMKVVCIDDNWRRPPSRGEVFPVKGNTYTIRDIESTRGNASVCGVYLRFEEICNKKMMYKMGLGKVSFNGDNFRPLVKTDISIFTAMLAPSPKQKVKA